MIIASNPSFKTLENQKYTHPIPNRNFILALLKKHGKALTRKELALRMTLSTEEELEGLRRRLRAMERDGQISFNQNSGYTPLNEDDLITGRAIGHRDGFGFLAREEGGQDLLLGSRDMQRIFDGDLVQVRLTGVDNRGREKARLVKILERNTTQLVGRLRVDDGDHYIVPENSRIAHEIDVDNSQLMGAETGQYVVVTITDYPCHQFRAFGKVTEVLGEASAPGMEIEIAIREHDIPNVWSSDAIAAAESLGSEVLESDKAHRVDLRKLPFVTIDGDDAKDFDDAVYSEKHHDGWRLYVAIADVSHYVTPGYVLDREARKRGTSVYFPGHVVPMLPEALSNGLCSLNPNVDRLAIVCEMRINELGEMTNYQFSEAVIQSHARLTYNQVNAILTKPYSKLGQRMKRKYASIVPQLSILHQLYGSLKKSRMARGSIEFETQETLFEFNEQRKVERIVPIQLNVAHKLIEECMLCANLATAQFLKKLKLPALYRNHNGPQQAKLVSLRRFLNDKGLRLTGGSKPKPIDYERLLRDVGERQDGDAIKSQMLRSLCHAEYSAVSRGHFGLAYSEYTHFTSPIRRYPDLLVHRAIRSIIRGQESGGVIRRTLKSITGIGLDPVKRIEGANSLSSSISYPYDMKSMEALALQCSKLSRRADKASWDVDSWLKCEYMSHAIGEEFYGVITTVTKFGLFVELKDTKIEGLVHISSLKDDYYRFDETNQNLIGERFNACYSIGDSLKIEIDKVDMGQKKIQFRLAID